MTKLMEWRLLSFLMAMFSRSNLRRLVKKNSLMVCEMAVVNQVFKKRELRGVIIDVRRYVVSNPRTERPPCFTDISAGAILTTEQVHTASR